MKKRTAEFVLGLIGGIIGIILGVLVLIGGSFLASASISVIGEDLLGGGSLMLYGIIFLAAALIGLIGSIVVRNKGTVGGLLMIIGTLATAAVLIISPFGGTLLFWLYVVVALLFLIGGLLGFIRKIEAADNSVAK